MKEPPCNRTPASPGPGRSQDDPPAVPEPVPYGIWIAGCKGDILYISDSLLDLTGMAPDAFQQPGWLHHIHPEDLVSFLAAWARCVATRERWNHRFRVLGTDGEYHTIHSRAMPIRDDDGNILLWAGINLDADDQRRLQRHTLEKERQARRMETLSRISEVIAQEEIDLQEISQQVIAWMPNGFRYPEQISTRIVIGRAVFMAGDNQPRRIVAELPAERGGAGYLEVEYQGPLPEGTQDPFKPQERDFVHTVATMIGAVIAREETKAALQSLERQHRLLADQMQESVTLLEVVCDSAGEPVDYRCIEINSRAEEEIGYEREETIGKTFFEVFPGTTHELRALLCRVAKTGTPEHCETQCLRPGGYHRVRAYRPHYDQIALVINDITPPEKGRRSSPGERGEIPDAG